MLHLEGVTSRGLYTHYYIKNTHHVRTRKYLGRMKFHVQWLRNMSRPIDLPAAENWQTFSQKVLAQHGVGFLLDRLTEKDLKPRFSLPNRFEQRVTAPVHCGCALAVHSTFRK